VKPIVRAMMALATLCAVGAATPQQQEVNPLSGMDVDLRSRRIASGVRDTALQEALRGDVRQFESVFATAGVRREVQERVSARLYLHQAARGAVSAEALAALGLQPNALLAAARSANPETSPVLLRARTLLPQERMLARLGPSPLTVDPDRPAPLGTQPAPAPATPPTYDSELGRFDRWVYREGFSQVVLLGRTAKPGGKAEAVCTATVLKGGWALTAAHCFFDAGERIPATQLALYLPFQGGAHTVRTQQAANERMLRANFDEADVVLMDPKFVPMYIASAEDVLQDLALVRLRNLPSTLKFRPTQINVGSIAKPFTFAGYGLTNAADAGKDGNTLEVARRTAQVDVLGSHIVFRTVAEGVGAGRVCLGDSGAPVFAGELNGSDPPSAFDLVGVVSGSVEGGGYVDACKSGSQFVVRVNTPRVKDWMCKSTAKAVCPA
jgi:hypothetical protein